jgi:hypothetical protein
MAHEWYVLHQGKAWGPLTSGQLKKLAAEGKVSPTTNVRSGAEGRWVPASRVQGLFAAPSGAAPLAAAASAAHNPAPASGPPPLCEYVAPPPLAPPIVTHVVPPAQAVMGSFVPLVPTAPNPAGSMAARILGAVSLVLGILALATFWLPYVGPLGWLGIGVGSLGLILGIAGFVVSARRQGSGLALNIAGTSSSLVGLVLTIVLGVLFGLFGRQPSPPIVAAVPAPPVAAEAKPEPVPEPQPARTEPAAEPVWTTAGQAIEQGPIRATIVSAKIEAVRLESGDLSTLKKSRPQPMLKVAVAIENTTTDRIVEVPGWPGGGDLIGTGASELLGRAAGKALQAATATATLSDNRGNAYRQVAALSLFGAQLPAGDQAVRPGHRKQCELVFPPPLDTIEYLRIELASAGFGGEEPLRFQIPREMIGGLASPTP